MFLAERIRQHNLEQLENEPSESKVEFIDAPAGNRSRFERPEFWFAWMKLLDAIEYGKEPKEPKEPKHDHLPE